MQLRDGEEVQFEVNANMKKGIEYAGGLLTITNERMYFTPHKFNINRKDAEIPLEEIEHANTSRVLGLSPNGLQVHLHDGTKKTFVVELPWSNKREKLIDYINEQIS